MSKNFDDVAYRKAYAAKKVNLHFGGSPETISDLEALEEYALQHRTTVQTVLMSLTRALVRDGIDLALIERARVGAAGTASGWWLVVIAGPNGAATDTEVQYVDNRAELEGHKFFRCEREDKKSKDSAEKKARRAEAEIRQLTGLDDDS